MTSSSSFVTASTVDEEIVAARHLWEESVEFVPSGKYYKLLYCKFCKGGFGIL